MDWELAKTKTLLYFYEYVMRKGEPQKVANLACTFGEKTFTEDMLSIVGRNLAGLKRFLSEHPYLFQIIDGELVYLNVNEPTFRAVVDRDCNDETKDYFKHKSLHGHRSQAPPSIRHTCGVTTNEFKQLLSQYPETFRIVDRSVLLLGYEDLKTDRNTLHSDLSIDGCNRLDKAPQRLEHRQIRGNRNEAISFKSSFNAENGEADSVATFGSVSDVSKVKLENLCLRNCPKICEVANISCAIQLCVGGTGSKVQIRKNTHIISTVADSLRVTGKILKFVVNACAQAVVSFNCKGSRVGARTKLTLLTIGTPNGDAFLFDVLTCPQIMSGGGVKALLENDRIVKVIHNSRYKAGNLYEEFKIILKCVFDTQLANAVLQYQKDGTKVNKVKAMSFHQLIQLYCPFNSVNEPLTYAWSGRKRPFTDEIAVYAAREVLALVQLFACMELLIEDENKALLSVVCTEEILVWIHPQQVKAQKLERNGNSDAAAATAKGKQNEVTECTEMACLSRSAASEVDYKSRASITQRESTRRHCCDCYVDKGSQTLSTGDIVMLAKTYDD